MVLHPDNRLREVQAARLQNGRVVSAIGIAAPKIKQASRFEHTGDVAEPGMQQAIEFPLGDEVIHQGPVFGTKLSDRALQLAATPSEIERLVMLRAFERAESGGNGVIAA